MEVESQEKKHKEEIAVNTDTLDEETLRMLVLNNKELQEENPSRPEPVQEQSHIQIVQPKEPNKLYSELTEKE